MPWFNVDDKFHSHRKAIKAGLAAIGLWTRAGSWSNDQGTDGFIPDYVVIGYGPEAESCAARLVEVGLWEVAEVDGEKGWMFHEWTGDERGRRNKTRAEVAEERRAGAERKARSRERMQRDRPVGHAGVTPHVTRDSDVTDAGVTPSVTPSPRAGHNDHSTPLHSLSSKPVTVTEVDPLTKQDQTKGKRSDSPITWETVRKAWCDEHGQPNDRECVACKVEHGDLAYYAKLRAAEAREAAGARR
jgi:hypothetical protein